MKDKISLAGDLGSGKSTVSDILISRIGAEYYSTGAIVREIAQRRGMTVTELNVYMETHPEIDHEIDDGIARLSEVDKLLIIDSRMAWHFTRGTFRVYLSVDVETSALRIMNANRVGEHCATFEETVAATKTRCESEKKRYMTQYGVNIKDLSNYDLVVDTTAATPDEVADVIVSAFAAWQNDRTYRATYLTGERVNFPDEAPEGEEIEALVACLERGEQIPPVTVVERDGEFYLVGGHASALAHTMLSTYVPATLVKGDVPDVTYVRMRNSL